MRRSELLSRAEDLRRARTPYVLATVVRAQRPTSAKAGDCALVLADGTLDGFVGGDCAESTVRFQGLRLLETGASTLLRITPSPAGLPEDEEEGLVVVNNPCLSGGSLEIFLEAMLPVPLIYVFGESPVARALATIGGAAGYEMSTHPIDRVAALPADVSAVVVASHGRGEEHVLEAALRAEVPYIALVASRKRGDAVLANVQSTRDRIHTPAGLDIGARTAPEVAISILAELIAHIPQTASHPTDPADSYATLPGSAASPAASGPAASPATSGPAGSPAASGPAASAATPGLSAAAPGPAATSAAHGSATPASASGAGTPSASATTPAAPGSAATASATAPSAPVTATPAALAERLGAGGRAAGSHTGGGQSARFGGPGGLMESAARRVLPMAPTETAIDPVCHMEVTITPTALRAEHAGKSYYFCASGCKAGFVKNPDAYLPGHD